MNEKEQCLASARKEIGSAWRGCQKLEKMGAEFGKKCYVWQEKLRNRGLNICAIWKELNIPRQTAYRWIETYLEAEGLKPIESTTDRSKTNADIINALVNRLENMQKAVEKVADDWAGWSEACSKECAELKKTIEKVGRCFVELNNSSK